MDAHERPLVHVERRGLGQDPHRQRRLADVVQQRGELDLQALLLGHVEAVGHDQRQAGDATGVLAQLAARGDSQLERTAAQAPTQLFVGDLPSHAPDNVQKFRRLEE